MKVVYNTRGAEEEHIRDKKAGRRGETGHPVGRQMVVTEEVACLGEVGHPQTSYEDEAIYEYADYSETYND